jgi:hypothetical protein
MCWQQDPWHISTTLYVDNVGVHRLHHAPAAFTRVVLLPPPPPCPPLDPHLSTQTMPRTPLCPRSPRPPWQPPPCPHRVPVPSSTSLPLSPSLSVPWSPLERRLDPGTTFSPPNLAAPTTSSHSGNIRGVEGGDSGVRVRKGEGVVGVGGGRAVAGRGSQNLIIFSA